MRPLSRFLKILGERVGVLRLFIFLKTTGTHRIPHSGKTLFDHLRNTYSLLKKWGYSEDIARAGLFHSVYGTQIFTRQTIPYAQRQEIQKLIGGQAEKLAYLFSVSSRPTALIEAFETLMLNDATTNSAITLSQQDLEALVAIELANLVDQNAHVGFCRRVLKGAIKLPISMGEPLLTLMQRYANIPSLNEKILDTESASPL